MKKINKKIVEDGGISELKKNAEEISDQLAALRLNKYTKPSKNLREYKNLRQKLAIIKTHIREKELMS